MTTVPIPVPPGLAERWQADTEPTHDGHLIWTSRQRYVPWNNRQYSPRNIAFALRTGRLPEGRVGPECGQRGCVKPDHVEDAPGRYRTRLAYRAVRGLPAPDPTCARGHDQAQHGRLEGTGKAYCAACTGLPDDAPRLRLLGDARQQAAKELQARYYKGATIRQLADETGRNYGVIHQLLASAGTQFRTPGYHPEYHASRWTA